MDFLSSISLYIDVHPPSGKHSFGQGTAFVVRDGEEYFLITARHCVVWHTRTQEVVDAFREGEPHHLTAMLPILRDGVATDWRSFDVRLYDEFGRRQWREGRHTHDIPYDVVALPLDIKALGDPPIPTVQMDLKDVDLDAAPADPVSIVGFPWGESAMGGRTYMPIWKTGYMASEIAVRWNGWPCFLIDATTTSGMSGSPVYVVRRDGFRTAKGKGVYLPPDGVARRFLGVYAGKVQKDRSDPEREGRSINVGVVWTAEAINAALRTQSPAELARATGAPPE